MSAPSDLDPVEAMARGMWQELLDPSGQSFATLPIGSATTDSVTIDGVYDLKDLVKAALSAADAAGFVLVPKEATREMVNAAHMTRYRDGSFSMYVVWRALLAAAPKP